MKLSEMKQLLDERGIQLTKSLGQNFLHDGNQLRRIVEAAALQPGDKVLEIGPGLGPLTGLLVKAAGEVLAIEKDRRLVEVLRERFGPGVEGASRLRLVHDDALDFLQREPRDWSQWKLVANLPFAVASPILVELAVGERSPERLAVTLQSEVARRLAARPGEADYGVLTLLVQVDFESRGWFKLSRTCFFPEPDVDSACICLVRRPQVLLTAHERSTFVRLVKRGFSQRRKMMLKLLKQEWPADRLEALFGELRLPPSVRAEKVSLEQFIGLARLLGQTCPHG